MTPDAAKIVFDTWAVTAMLGWGILCKYVPMLKAIPNMTIGWINLAGYIVAKFIVPDAHAAGGIVGATGVVLGGIVNSGWAMIIYETLGRTLLEKWLRLKKA